MFCLFFKDAVSLNVTINLFYNQIKVKLELLKNPFSEFLSRSILQASYFLIFFQMAFVGQEVCPTNGRNLHQGVVQTSSAPSGNYNFYWLAAWGWLYIGSPWQLNHFVVKTLIPATAFAAIFATSFLYTNSNLAQ